MGPQDLSGTWLRKVASCPLTRVLLLTEGSRDLFATCAQVIELVVNNGKNLHCRRDCWPVSFKHQSPGKTFCLWSFDRTEHHPKRNKMRTSNIPKLSWILWMKNGPQNMPPRCLECSLEDLQFLEYLLLQL